MSLSISEIADNLINESIKYNKIAYFLWEKELEEEFICRSEGYSNKETYDEYWGIEEGDDELTWRIHLLY